MKTKNLLPFCTLTILIVLGSGCTPTPDPMPVPTPSSTLTGCLMTVIRNTQGSVMYAYEYNAQHKLTKIAFYNNSTGAAGDSYIMTYNTVGKIASHYYLMAGRTSTDFKNIVTYDGNNNPILIESINELTHLAEFKIVLTYDSSNRLIGKQNYRLTAGVFVLSQTLTLTYTTDAYRPTQALISFTSGTDIRFLYTYDANHNLLSSARYKPAASTAPDKTSYFTYDNTNGQKKPFAEYNGLGSGFDENYHNFQYDRNNIIRQVNKQYYSTDGSLTGADSSTTAFTFNPQNYPITTTSTPNIGAIYRVGYDYSCY